MLNETANRLWVLWRTLLLLVITGVFVFPVYWTLSLSVKPRSIMFSLPPKWLYKPIWEYDAKTLAKDLGAHIAYGAGTAGAFRLLAGG